MTKRKQSNMTKRKQARDSLTDGTGLSGLKHEETGIILDFFEELRQHGVEDEVSLPRLVVAGDTSSGKSSVLQRLTGIPFPTGDGVVTRFATEVAMRQSDKDSVRITIRPDESRPLAEKRRLTQFTRTITSLDDYESVHEQATDVMDIQGVDSKLVKDVLRIDIRGPTQNPLTIVDLPGLIQATSKKVKDKDKTLSHAIVEEYLKNPRTITLAIVSASNDYVNQAVTQKAREQDPEGRRTLGIITKPDRVAGQPMMERQWMELAQNQDIVLQLGWHVLMNKAGEDDDEFAILTPDEAEADFFGNEHYAELDQQCLGIGHLKSRLSQVLHKSLIDALPELKIQFVEKFEGANRRLCKLGDSRTDAKAQRIFLTTIANNFSGLAQAGVDGNYSSTFFQGNESFDSTGTGLKLRAKVQNMNIEFGRAMRLYGAAFRIEGVTSIGVKNLTTQAEGKAPMYSEWIAEGRQMDEKEALAWVLTELMESRGSELPGSVNSVLMKTLFWKLARKWGLLTERHVKSVHRVCLDFIEGLVRYTVGPEAEEVTRRLCRKRIAELMDRGRQQALQCLADLVKDEREQPITYNPRYMMEVQKARNRKNMKLVDKFIERQNEAFHGLQADRRRQVVDVEALANSIDLSHSRNIEIDTVGAEDTLDQVSAYYSTELDYFIDAVAKQVIERQIIKLIPDVLSPQWVSTLSAEELNGFAAEPAKITKEREQLEKIKQSMLFALDKYDDLAQVCNMDGDGCGWGSTSIFINGLGNPPDPQV